mmetsp:Transcript_2566/g.7380  ORF Transcript_2566/g.7380 Transcript_2566/m.7380 type:complete len:790 (-) Transcript_2566:180-2549(-)
MMSCFPPCFDCHHGTFGSCRPTSLARDANKGPTTAAQVTVAFEGTITCEDKAAGIQEELAALAATNASEKAQKHVCVEEQAVVVTSDCPANLKLADVSEEVQAPSLANELDEEAGLPPLGVKWQVLYEQKPFSPKSLFPPLIWIPQYWRTYHGGIREEDRPYVGELPFSLKGDTIAGLTVGVMLVPQCLAFALLAGLPIQTGLYSSFLPLLVYALFGTMRQVQTGPTALMCLLTGQALDSLGVMTPGPRVAGATLMALLVAAISLVLGMMRVGGVVSFISHSVLTAFCTAAGITIGTSQIKHVLGVKLPRSAHWWETVRDLFSALGSIHVPTFVMGSTILIGLLTLKYWKSAGCAAKRSQHRIWRFFPKDKASLPFRALKLVADLSSLIAVLTGALWAAAYRSAGIDGVVLVGDVEADGLIVALPGQGYYSELLGDSTLFVSAGTIAVVGFLESVAVGGKFAAMSKYIFDPNQELIALGLANLASSFVSGFPVTGGFSRSAVNVTFGATSLLSVVISSLLVLLAVYILLPAIALLPLASMAPIIMQGAIVFIDVHEFQVAFRSYPGELLVMIATLIVSLALTVKEGLLAGFVCSVLKTLYEIANPNLALVGEIQGNFRDMRYFPQAQQAPNAVVVRMDAQVHFANSGKLKDFVFKAVQVRESMGTKIDYAVIDGKSVNSIDLTGCQMLEGLAEALAGRKQKLVVANLKAPIAALLHTTGVQKHIKKHGGQLCLDLHEAMDLIADPTADWSAAADKVNLLVETRGSVGKSPGGSMSPTVRKVEPAGAPSP